MQKHILEEMGELGITNTRERLLYAKLEYSEDFTVFLSQDAAEVSGQVYYLGPDRISVDCTRQQFADEFRRRAAHDPSSLTRENFD